MSYKDTDAKQTQNRCDRFDHLTHPVLLLGSLIADPGFGPASLAQENGFTVRAAIGLQTRFRHEALAELSILAEVLDLIGSPGWIRTSDHSINSRMLYR